MSVQAQNIQKNSAGTIINTLIGLCVMIIGPFMKIPSFSFPTSPKLEGLGFEAIDGFVSIALSPAGFTAAIIFLGALWLWIFVDTFWPSILAVCLVALSPHFHLQVVLAQYMGGQTTFLMFFMFLFVTALIKTQVVNYISNFFLTIDLLQGKPWLLIFTLMVVTYTACFFDGLATVFMMWPVTYLILSETGYKPGDKVATFMVGNIIAAFILSTASIIVIGPMLFMSSGYTAFVTRNPELGLSIIDPVKWTLLLLVISLCTSLLIIFAMRFIFRVDVEAIRNFDTSKFKENPLPPLNWKQKSILTLFLLFVIWMFLPNLLPQNLGITAYLKSKQYIGSMLLFLALISIKHKGEPLAKVNELAAGAPWAMFFLLASAFYFGGLLTDASTNIPILLELAISNSLVGLSYVSFLLITFALAFVISNLMNSIVAGIVLAPIIANIATTYGFDPLPIVIIFLIGLSSAILTPAAGIPAAFLFGNKEWLPGKEASFYGIFFATCITIVTLVVAIPLAQLLF